MGDMQSSGSAGPTERQQAYEMKTIFAGLSIGSHTSIAESKTAWLCLVIAVGGILRLYGLDFQSLWLDEGLQYHVAAHNSITELFFQKRSFHPPLSFAINHFFLLIGESDFLLRLPSALFGIASLPVLYVLAKDLTSARNSLFVVLVLAISPFHLWYSQDGRMYSQLLFFSLLSSALLIQALRRGKARWWIYYTLAGAAGMYTHVFMMLTLGTQFVWVLLFHRRHWLAFAASGVGVALFFLPWVILLPWVSNFVSKVGTVGLAGGSISEGRAGVTWAALPYTFFVYAAGFSLGPAVAELHENRSAQFILSFLPSILLVGIIFAILLGTGLLALYKRWGLEPPVVALLGLGLPLAAAIVYASSTSWSTFNVRYTVIAFPYFCLIVGTALSRLTHANKALGAMALLAVIGISAASIHNYFANPRYAKEDVRSAVAFWRHTGEKEPLFALGSTYPAQRYVGGDTKRLFSVVGKDIVSPIQQVLAVEGLSSAYVMVARDWDRARETAIRNAFSSVLEKTYPGVKIFKIYDTKLLEMSDSPDSPRATP
jgi:4-amino-4-deoxy-L-arabinose transferase-like glycosyltransferase